MAVHTWVSVVFIALGVTHLASFFWGWEAHTRFSYRNHTQRHAALSMDTAGHTPAPATEPLRAPAVVHVHMHPLPTGTRWRSSWSADIPVLDSQVVRELPGGPLS